MTLLAILANRELAAAFQHAEQEQSSLSHDDTFPADKIAPPGFIGLNPAIDWKQSITPSARYRMKYASALDKAVPDKTVRFAFPSFQHVVDSTAISAVIVTAFFVVILSPLVYEARDQVRLSNCHSLERQLGLALGQCT